MSDNDTKSRLVWKESMDKTFLESCIEQVSLNGREGCGFKASVWRTIGEKLKTEHGVVADQKQMKNHYDYYKSKYQAWVKLKNKTGNIYDPITNTFNLTNEEWKVEGKLNKYVSKLRTAPLLFPDLCTELFEVTTSTGFQAWGPSSTQPEPVNEVTIDDSDDIESIPVETPPPTQNRGASEESSVHSKKKRDGGTKKVGGNKRTARTLEVEEELIKVARSLLTPNEPIGPSEMDKDMDACMAKLEQMEWGEEDPRHQTAVLLFGESVNLMKVWLRLKPSSCESWVRNAGRKYNLFT